MKKPVQSDIEDILRTVDSLRRLTMTFDFDGKSYTLDGDETVKVISSGVYRYLWSKYQSQQLQDEKKRVKMLEEELRRRGGDPSKIRPQQ